MTDIRDFIGYCSSTVFLRNAEETQRGFDKSAIIWSFILWN